MNTPIADKFYHDAKDAPVERLGQIVGRAYTTIERLERERDELLEVPSCFKPTLEMVNAINYVLAKAKP